MQKQSELLEGWELVSINDILEVNPSKPQKDVVPPNTPVTFVPMPAVDADSGAINAPEIRDFSKVRKGYTAFQNEDVIFAKITPCMENGKAAVARNLLNNFGFGSTEFFVFRSKGAKAGHVDKKDRVVLVLEIPTTYIKKHMAPIRARVSK